MYIFHPFLILIVQLDRYFPAIILLRGNTRSDKRRRNEITIHLQNRMLLRGCRVVDVKWSALHTLHFVSYNELHRYNQDSHSELTCKTRKSVVKIFRSAYSQGLPTQGLYGTNRLAQKNA